MPRSGRNPPSALEALGGRIGRHGSIYGGALFITLAVGLVNVAVLTRLLDPGPFGDLAVLLVFSSLLTIVFNLGVLQGAMRVAYGSSDEEFGHDEKATDVEGADGRRLLGSAILFSVGLATLGVLISAALAASLSQWLLGRSDEGVAVVWAAACGGLGAVWRVVVNLLRLDRRPVWWGVAQNLRPAVGLAIAIPLVANGGGASAVLAGLAIGTAVSLALALVLTHRNYRFRPARGDVTTVLKLGAGMIPVVIVFWLLANGDVFLLSRFVAAGDVGVYRVASRVGGTIAYLNSAIFMAWGPMLREPIHAAAERERGSGVVAPMLTRYYLMLGIWAVLGLAVFAPYLAAIAPKTYHGVAPLIPLAGLAVLLHGAFIATYRTVEFGNKRNAFIWLVAVSGVVFLVAAFLLIPWLGTYGAVAATAISPATGAALMITLARHEGDTTRLPFRPLALAIFAAGLCLGIGLTAATLPDPWSALGRIAAFALFPLALVTVHAVPRSHLASALAVARELVRRHETGIAGRLNQLPAADVALLAALVRDQKEPRDVGAGDESSVHERFASALASVAGMSRTEFPSGVGEYLLWKGSVSERDRKALGLWSQDVDPIDVDRLTITLRSLRSLPSSAWPDGAQWAPVPVPIPGVSGDPVLP